MVHLEAKRGCGIPRDQPPKVAVDIRERHLMPPLAAIVITGRTPMRATIWAILPSIVACMLRRSTDRAGRYYRRLEQGAEGPRCDNRL